MSKHTAGNWRVEKDLDCFDIKTDQQTVAMLDDNGGETEANAQLIASSPELLEMLKIAVERCEINNCSGEEDEFITMFDSVIARAEGH